MKNVWFYGLCVGIIGSAVATIFVMDYCNQRRMDLRAERYRSISEAQNQKPVSQNKDEPPGPDWVKVGGVWRPKSSVEAAMNNREKRRVMEENAPNDRSLLPNPGKSSPINLEANANTQSVKEAIQTRTRPERVSVFGAPKFDREAYLADKQAYVDEHVPGRIWQQLARGEGVEEISRTSTYYKKILQGETVILRAKTERGMPISFMSFELGEFDNGLTSITVIADEEGVGEARFTASPGTQGDIDIIATSPVRSGRARYLVNVVLPKGSSITTASSSEAPTTVNQ